MALIYLIKELSGTVWSLLLGLSLILTLHVTIYVIGEKARFCNNLRGVPINIIYLLIGIFLFFLHIFHICGQIKWLAATTIINGLSPPYQLILLNHLSILLLFLLIFLLQSLPLMIVKPLFFFPLNQFHILFNLANDNHRLLSSNKRQHGFARIRRVDYLLQDTNRVS